ncbi:NUDIX domain-containing protein [Chromatium okenii]|uniref:GDP-mannose pyrophosphatase n=1 Tax=Chromatium okenii TaxID=61644 RepID=A0A2S7XRP9_9GAMM|nr:NUDIX hydrolase [Chromatium okenii]MBV5310692.1 NUDIX hydrolase [Chromatium okenii]PQJ96407.1 NUDIX hydrolase [Chromatium okenii]
MNNGQLLKCEPIHQGRVIELTLETVELPNGDQVELEIIHHPGGAAAVAIDERNHVCLLRQFRHASQGWLWELPAGRIDAGESAANTAQRELAEEAGLSASEWISLSFIHSSPGIFTEVIHLWLARDLAHLPTAHEHGEVIEITWLPLDQALAWCNDGTITDSKTLVGLYRADAFIKNAVELRTEDQGC